MRLIDLHCNWALQYALESSQYDPRFYADVSGRLDQLEGYLMGTRLAVLACSRRAEDWSAQPQPWFTLGEMIARYEAEFPGRLIQSPADIERWAREPEDGLCWGVLGIAGFDALVRDPGDLDRLASLFARGVRVFQLVETGAGALGGHAGHDDDRGMTELGHQFLGRLLDLAPPMGQAGPRPVVDLAGLNARTTSDVLDWFEADAERHGRLLLARSHGSVDLDGLAGTSGLTSPNLDRLRTLGGVIGLSCCLEHFLSADALLAAIEAIASRAFLGREGYWGIGLGTDFFNAVQPLKDLGNVESIVGWLEKSFGAEAAALIGSANAENLLLRAAGVAKDS